jgi:hypothetical protein
MPIGLLALGGGALLYAVHRLLSASPVQEGFEAATWNLAPNLRTPQNVCVQLRLWGIYDEGTYAAKMRSLGYDEGKAGEILVAGQMWLDSHSVIVAGRREGLDEGAIIEDLVGHGWNRAEAGRLMVASRYYPSPSDLIHWQAREVFEPGMISKYGLDDEFGNLKLDDFYKVGMNDEQILNHWRAHWEHASWTQVQQMLFRRLINESDVRDWFRLVEIPPFWRQKMIDSAYHPLTRVDVRRMHRVKTLTDADLVWAYMDVGFSKKNAELMAEFTIAYNAGPEDAEAINLTRAQVESAYRIGFIGAGEATGYLEDMEYSDEEITFIIALIDHTKSIEVSSNWISILRAQVKSGLITPQEAADKLAALGFSSGAVESYTQLFSAYAAEPDKLPSKTDVKAWFVGDIISPSEVATYLSNLGYCDRDIEHYREQWGAID